MWEKHEEAAEEILVPASEAGPSFSTRRASTSSELRQMSSRRRPPPPLPSSSSLSSHSSIALSAKCLSIMSPDSERQSLGSVEKEELREIEEDREEVAGEMSEQKTRTMEASNQTTGNLQQTGVAGEMSEQKTRTMEASNQTTGNLQHTGVAGEMSEQKPRTMEASNQTTGNLQHTGEVVSESLRHNNGCFKPIHATAGLHKAYMDFPRAFQNLEVRIVGVGLRAAATLHTFAELLQVLTEDEKEVATSSRAKIKTNPGIRVNILGPTHQLSELWYDLRDAKEEVAARNLHSTLFANSQFSVKMAMNRSLFVPLNESDADLVDTEFSQPLKMEFDVYIETDQGDVLGVGKIPVPLHLRHGVWKLPHSARCKVAAQAERGRGANSISNSSKSAVVTPVLLYHPMFYSQMDSTLNGANPTKRKIIAEINSVGKLFVRLMRITDPHPEYMQITDPHPDYLLNLYQPHFYFPHFNPHDHVDYHHQYLHTFNPHHNEDYANYSNPPAPLILFENFKLSQIDEGSESLISQNEEMEDESSGCGGAATTTFGKMAMMKNQYQKSSRDSALLPQENNAERQRSSSVIEDKKMTSSLVRSRVFPSSSTKELPKSTRSAFQNYGSQAPPCIHLLQQQNNDDQSDHQEEENVFPATKKNKPLQKENEERGTFNSRKKSFELFGFDTAATEKKEKKAKEENVDVLGGSTGGTEQREQGEPIMLKMGMSSIPHFCGTQTSISPSTCRHHPYLDKSMQMKRGENSLALRMDKEHQSARHQNYRTSATSARRGSGVSSSGRISTHPEIKAFTTTTPIHRNIPEFHQRQRNHKSNGSPPAPTFTSASEKATPRSRRSFSASSTRGSGSVCNVQPPRTSSSLSASKKNSVATPRLPHATLHKTRTTTAATITTTLFPKIPFTPSGASFRSRSSRTAANNPGGIIGDGKSPTGSLTSRIRSSSSRACSGSRIRSSSSPRCSGGQVRDESQHQQKRLSCFGDPSSLLPPSTKMTSQSSDRGSGTTIVGSRRREKEKVGHLSQTKPSKDIHQNRHSEDPLPSNHSQPLYLPQFNPSHQTKEEKVASSFFSPTPHRRPMEDPVFKNQLIREDGISRLSSESYQSCQSTDVGEVGEAELCRN